jgi:hypothetical protein|tara:strand:- start:439 stop:651 length:213 start_codon:yes stop_codon:yes gene_type:complete
VTDREKLELARRIYTRSGFFEEYKRRLNGTQTASETYYLLEMAHDDLFGVFKFPTLNAFFVWISKRRAKK